MRFRPLAIVLAALPVAALAPAVASADTVVPNTQIVQGAQCLGPLCADGDALGGPQMWIKNNDTPGVRLLQGAGGGFPAQTWDAPGNEANFFVRDVTGGSRLPFRIRPGAPTSAVDIQATGAVNTEGVVEQRLASITPTAALDGDAVLAALRTLAVAKYTSADGTHAAPTAFSSAFGVG